MTVFGELPPDSSAPTDDRTEVTLLVDDTPGDRHLQFCILVGA